MRDLVDLPGQEFIYVELELHLVEMTGQEAPLPPLPRRLVADPLRLPPSRRARSRPGDGPRESTSPPGGDDDGARPEYGRCTRTLPRRLHSALLIVTWTSIGPSPFLSLPLSSLTLSRAPAAHGSALARLGENSRRWRGTSGPRNRHQLRGERRVLPEVRSPQRGGKGGRSLICGSRGTKTLRPWSGGESERSSAGIDRLSRAREGRADYTLTSRLTADW